MKKLSEFKDEQAFDVLIEILEPAINLISDDRFKTALKGDKEKGIKPDKLNAVKVCLEYHRDDIVTIMAVLNETPVEEFHYNILTLPTMLLQIFNDEELVDFFKSQSTEISEAFSGSATENTEEAEK